MRHELIAPLGPASPVHRVLERQRGGVYHVAYQLPHFDGLDDAVRAAGGRLLSRTSGGWDGLEIAFALFEVGGGSWTLCEFVWQPGHTGAAL